MKRRDPELFLLVRRPNASLKQEKYLAGVFDAICVGEGKYATLEQLNSQLEVPIEYGSTPKRRGGFPSAVLPCEVAGYADSM